MSCISEAQQLRFLSTTYFSTVSNWYFNWKKLLPALWQNDVSYRMRIYNGPWTQEMLSKTGKVLQNITWSCWNQIYPNLPHFLHLSEGFTIPFSLTKLNDIKDDLSSHFSPFYIHMIICVCILFFEFYT